MATEVPDRIDRFQASYGTSAILNLWLKAHAVCGEIQRSVDGTGRPVLDLRGTNTRERGGVCALRNGVRKSAPDFRDKAEFLARRAREAAAVTLSAVHPD